MSLSLSFSDSFQEGYQEINKMYWEWDLEWLRLKREFLFNEESRLVTERSVAHNWMNPIKEKTLINLQLSDVHNLVALVSRRINELMEEEKFYNPDM